MADKLDRRAQPSPPSDDLLDRFARFNLHFGRFIRDILGVLLISDNPAQSITDIAEKLNASKSSISIMARLLIESGLIDSALRRLCMAASLFFAAT